MNDEQREKLQQEVVRRYENLSDELKRAMMSVSSAEIIYEVGRKHGLNVEKIGVLAEEIGYIMLGMIPPSGFISDLKDLLEVEENKANEIGQEINHKIFLPIREEMKRIYGTSFSEETITERQETSDMRQGTIERPTPPPIPQRPTPPFIPSQPMPTPRSFPQRPVPPTIPPRPTPEFGSGPRMPVPHGAEPPGFRPTAPAPPPFAMRSTPPPTPSRPTQQGLGRSTPPPIFIQPKEITQTEEIKATGQPPTTNSQPPTPANKPTWLEVGSGKLEVGLPEVEEELKPKLLESLPKEKPLEARIAEKTPPKYHTDPYRETFE